MQPPYIEEIIIALMIICFLLFFVVCFIGLANMGRDFEEEEPISILGYVPEKTGFRISFICFLLSVGLYGFFKILF